MSAAAVYHRAGAIIVVPQGGGGGHFIDVEPIEILSPTDVEGLQRAVETALRVSAASPYADAPPKGWKTPVLRRVGVKSYKAFAAGASLCFVFEDAGAIEVERWRPARDGRGFEPAPGGRRPFRSLEGLGAAVLRALEV